MPELIDGDETDGGDCEEADPFGGKDCAEAETGE